MKILLLANSVPGLLSFRKEVVHALVKEGHQVCVAAPENPRKSEVEALGASCRPVEIESRGTNPLHDLALALRFAKIIRQERPDMVLTYTIKPNLYGGLAARMCRVPQIANITGLGTALENPGLLQKFIQNYKELIIS